MALLRLLSIIRIGIAQFQHNIGLMAFHDKGLLPDLVVKAQNMEHAVDQKVDEMVLERI